MNFFTQLKCALCPRWSCPVRYQIGNRTFLSGLGFISTKCPKKLEKDPLWCYTRNLNQRLTEERLERKQNKNIDDNGKNEE